MSAEEAHNAALKARREKPPVSQAEYQKVSDINKCLYNVGVIWTDVRIESDSARTGSSLGYYSDMITEIDGKSSDINHGFGGDYVYLTFDGPANYKQKFWVAFDIMFDIYNSAIPGKDDIAHGAGGMYRYLTAVGSGQTLKGSRVIIDAGLWRPGYHSETPPSGWHDITPDLNGGRHGDYLYLVWKYGTWDGEEYPIGESP